MAVTGKDALVLSGRDRKFTAPENAEDRSGFALDPAFSLAPREQSALRLAKKSSALPSTRDRIEVQFRGGEPLGFADSEEDALLRGRADEFVRKTLGHCHHRSPKVQNARKP
jgi:hypothetical protein